MKKLLAFILWLVSTQTAVAEGKLVQTPYQNPKAVFEFYLDDPQKMGSALFWLRSYINTLSDAPYGLAPEDINAVVVIHGTEIVTTVTHNEKRYEDTVDRMRYYAAIGVKFKVCGQAAADFGYSLKDFQDFIEVVPNAMAEVAHWQQQGYGLVIPQIYEKRINIEKLR